MKGTYRTDGTDGAGSRSGGFFRRGVESIARGIKTAGSALHGSARGYLVQGAEAGKGKVRPQLISPSPRDRWQSSLTRMSPVAVKSVLWGALNGDLVNVEELWETMQQTWPMLAKNQEQVRSAVSKVRYGVKPFSKGDEEPTARALEKAEFIEEAQRCWAPDPTVEENGFEDCIYDLTDAFGKGLSLQEVLWTRRSDGLIVPRASVRVHPRYYGIAPTGTRIQLRMGGPGTSWSDIPLDQFLLGIYKTKSGSALTGGWFRVLALWWCAATFGYDWFLGFAERYGMPMIWATFATEADAVLQGQLADMLANLGFAGWGMFPAGTDIKLVESGKAGAMIPQERLIEAADKVCNILILGQTLTTDVGASGSLALGGVHQDVLAGKIQGYARWVANVLSYQLIPTMLRLNYGDDEECPSLEPDLGTKEDAVQIFKRDVFKAFLADGTVNDVLANLTDLKELTRDCGLPVNEEYIDPYLPVTSQTGGAVTGEVVKDSEGDIVGGVAGGGEAGGGSDRSSVSGDQVGEGLRTKPEQKESAAEGEDAIVQAENPNHDPAGGMVQAADGRDGKGGDDGLMASVKARLPQVKARWLGGAKPVFERLVQAAQSERVSDAELTQMIERTRKDIPEMHAMLDGDAIKDSLEGAMGAAMVNGAVAGAERRQGKGPKGLEGRK